MKKYEIDEFLIFDYTITKIAALQQGANMQTVCERPRASIFQIGHPQPTAPELGRLVELWRQAWSRRQWPPSRGDLSFLDLRPWLGRIAVFDVATNPVRVTLWGSALVEETGMELTGRTVDQASFGLYACELAGLLRAAATSMAPVLDQGDMTWCDRPWRRRERLFLPFSDGGGGVTRIVVANAEPRNHA